MAKIDWASIEAKAKAALDTPRLSKKLNEKLDDIMLGKAKAASPKSQSSLPFPVLAADKYIEILQLHIEAAGLGSPASGALGGTAIDALWDLKYTKPKKVGPRAYLISIYFSNNLHRASLDPLRYPEGVRNLAALLNNGYTAHGTVSGIWHGEWIQNLLNRSGTHFMGESMREFLMNYASKYGVIGSRFGPDYE